MKPIIQSPFTPGVGLEPRYLAGRDSQIAEYRRRLGTGQVQQKNTLITGLRGVGKSVLLRTLSKEAVAAGWIPVSRELSRRTNNEDELIQGLLADVALRLKGVTISRAQSRIGIGNQTKTVIEKVDLGHVSEVFRDAPGNKGDKLLRVLQFAADIIVKLGGKGLVLMLDEFDVLEDLSGNYCMSLILDCVSRLQSSSDSQMHAVFAGLPTMVPKMAESKPHAERLFTNHVDLGGLSTEEGAKAITRPLEEVGHPELFSKDLVDYIVFISEGYPFFIQYFADEAVNNFEHTPIRREDLEKILPEVFAKLDEHFYSPRFSQLTGKERAVTLASALVSNPFSPTELLGVVAKHKGQVSMGTIQQYLLKLQSKNIMYRVKRGTYDYALPLTRDYLGRCIEGGEDPDDTLKDLGQD